MNITPEGWVMVRIGDVMRFIGGGTPDRTEARFWDGDISWASVKDIKGVYLKNTQEHINQSGIDSCATSVADPGTVILATRICPGRAIESRIQTAINQDLKIIVPKIPLLSSYIRLFFNSIEEKCQTLSSGTTVLGLSLNTLNEIFFCLPPLPEQARIVAKIEELFSSLEAGVESLKTAKEQLKAYRKAVLKRAFEKAEATRPLSDLALIKRGRSMHRPRDDKKLYGGQYPFIQTGDVRAANGGVIRHYSQTYSELGLAQSRLWPKGTLCLTIAANIADTAFLGLDACFPDSIVGITASSGTLSLEFLNYFIRMIKEKIEGEASATAQKNINVEYLEKLEIPIMPIDTQKTIVSEIESRFSACDKLEETIDQGLAQAEALRQSILKKAFEGKLVPQDPNDEPASVLLERIRSERAEAEKAKPRKKSTTGPTATTGSHTEPEPKRRPGRPRKSKES